MSPCLFNLYSEYIIQNARLDEAQAGIKIARRNINNLRYADNTTLMAESEEKLKSPLMKMKEEREKTGLKLNIQKTKIIASGPLTSWQIEREKVESCDRFSSLGLWSHHFMANRWEIMEAVSEFIFLASKITAEGDCSHENKRHLLLGRKIMTNLAQFSSVQFSHLVVSNSATPGTAACQASLSITSSRSSLRLKSIESVIPFSHLILCLPFSSCPQSLTASESFPMSQHFA